MVANQEMRKDDSKRRDDSDRDNKSGRDDILLHACCAPCSTTAIDFFQMEDAIGGKDQIFFCNPNIYPKEEYMKRLGEMRRYAKIKGIPLIESEYDHEGWLDYIAGFEDEKEGGQRCLKCFEFRMKKASILAEEMDMNFATSLTVSPYKDSVSINSIGKSLSLRYIETDFKKKDGYKRSIELSREHGLYRQKYCGCEFSIPEKKR